MDNQAAATTGNDSAGKARNRGYNVGGTVTKLTVKTDIKDRPYTVVEFDCMMQGKQKVRTALAQGKNHAAIDGKLAVGPARLFVVFDKGGLLGILGMGAALLTEEEKAIRAAERQAKRAAA